MPEIRGKLVVRQLSELKEEVYVRTQIDEDYVMKLAALYEAGEELPPLHITKDNIIVDGRNRKAALELALRKECQCLVMPDMPKVELLAHALAQNEGGARPMDRTDIVYTIKQMMETGAADRKVYDLLEPHYPKGFLRPLIEKARENIRIANINHAKDAVVHDGLTIREAALKFGIDAKVLQNAMARKRSPIEKRGLTQHKNAISGRAYPVTRANQAQIKRVVEGVIDGTIDPDMARQIVAHMRTVIRRQMQLLDRWELRVEAAAGGKIMSWNDSSFDQEAGQLGATA